MFFLKVVISALLIAGISELAKRSSTAGAILASLPIVSILGIIWLYLDTKDVARVSALSYSIFWAVLPSLLFFIVLPLLLKRMGFAPALTLSMAIMVAAYAVYAFALNKIGIQI